MTGYRPRLEGRSAIVTGAGRGIGRAIALRLAQEGARVAVVGRTEQSLLETVAAVQDSGGVAVAMTADVSREGDADRVVGRTVDLWGGADILVNNAAIFDEPPFLELSLETLRGIFEINLFGAVLMSQAAARRMAAAGGGSIVNISSVDALGADGPVAAYAASKAALLSLTQTTAMELAPCGIRVNSVIPGFVNTEMTRNSTTAANLEHMTNGFPRVPMRRLLEPEEIASAVAFLASGDASAMTGTSVVVDGGLSSNLYILETLPDPIATSGDTFTPQ